MNLILRGHIRNAFGDRGLYEFVKGLSERSELKIFVHTWKVFQTSRSWRPIPRDDNPVNEAVVLDYLGDMSKFVKSLTVDDESKLEVPGRRDGTIGHTPCPALGYKYMFYGMMKAAECALEHASPDETVVQTRFDVMSNWRGFTIREMLDFCSKKPTNRIQFMMKESYDESTVGIDNIYMANASDMYDFIRHMYLNLDQINERHRAERHMGHQEWLTMFEAMRFNSCSSPSPPG